MRACARDLVSTVSLTGAKRLGGANLSSCGARGATSVESATRVPEAMSVLCLNGAAPEGLSGAVLAAMRVLCLRGGGCAATLSEHKNSRPCSNISIASRVPYLKHARAALRRDAFGARRDPVSRRPCAALLCAFHFAATIIISEFLTRIWLLPNIPHRRSGSKHQLADYALTPSMAIVDSQVCPCVPRASLSLAPSLPLSLSLRACVSAWRGLPDSGF